MLSWMSEWKKEARCDSEQCLIYTFQAGGAVRSLERELKQCGHDQAARQASQDEGLERDPE